MTHSPPNDTSGSDLTPRELEVLITIERTGAGLSMAAITLTLLSYVLFRKLRTTPNLFIVLASIANAGASVASMIGYDGLDDGENSSLCQAQGFIFEWFMQSDPWWSFAMAFNVFLVFFNNADPTSFRKNAWIYCIVCFGGPMIPAVVLISIRNHPNGPVFGNAAMWCWIGKKWGLVRLYAYYIPIWACIFGSIIIYILVGYHVFHHRNQLRNLARQASEKNGTCTSVPTSEAEDSAEESLTRRPDFYGTAITEVKVTSDLPDYGCYELPTAPAAVHASSIVACGRSWAVTHEEDDYSAGVGKRTQQFSTICTSDHKAHHHITMLSRLQEATSSASLKLKRLDPVKMAYLRTSFIFGFAILITWIPSSINRLYSLAHEGRVSFQWSIASGCVLPLQGVWNALIYFTTS